MLAKYWESELTRYDHYVYWSRMKRYPFYQKYINAGVWKPGSKRTVTFDCKPEYAIIDVSTPDKKIVSKLTHTSNQISLTHVVRDYKFSSVEPIFVYSIKLDALVEHKKTKKKRLLALRAYFVSRDNRSAEIIIEDEAN